MMDKIEHIINNYSLVNVYLDILIWEMEIVSFVISVVQVVLDPYQLIAFLVLTTKLHLEYLNQINAYAKISTLMIIKIRYAKHVHQHATPVRILKTTV